jgi:AbrB family looped-hinge helix DNA binding protein
LEHLNVGDVRAVFDLELPNSKKPTQRDTDDENNHDAGAKKGEAEEGAQSPFQNMGQKLLETQMDFVRNATMGQAEAFRGFLNSMQAFTSFGAVFKTTVQKAGRISIPEAERAALGIKEGDLVQVVVLPLRKGAER